MRYSVWNQQTSAFDYYDAPVPASDAPPNPKHLKARGMGLAPNEAGWPLPPNAKWVGRGPAAQGYVATSGADAGAPVNWIAIIGFGAAALLLWRKR